MVKNQEIIRAADVLCLTEGEWLTMNMGNLKIQNIECLRRLLESQTKYKNAMENLVKLIQRQNQYQQQHQHQETVAEGFTERFKVLETYILA